MSIVDSSQFIKSVKKNPENFFIVHYSCQNLNDDNEALSPRITSIAINHFSSGQSVSFSTHSISEEMHIPRDDVIQRFDEVELELLAQFYRFIRDRRDKFWVHWNMRNLTYGFEHLEHRYRVLGGSDACVIAVERRLNLNDLIADRYGPDYAKHPKMLSLMELNGGRHRDLLSGEEEVACFENKEFLRMHTSTLSKVGFFSSAMSKLVSGKLKTAAKGYGVQLDKLFGSRLVKSLGLISIIFGLPVAIWQLYLWIM
ncbi:hypothetical protein ABN239_09950 [Providencia vermicola]|uniref:hypothetical protein n=1 Tax=Providencia TaxID=586 RepID=UPI0014044F46|nr:hypothetical protein [Providencia rettgeri]ELR5198333.1 hypothetical protein [Providencia rettgeri]NHN51325.1 hypothetical protein [Providencia rettgeri]